MLDERYEIQRMVARGGMGHVFQAHDRKSGEPVAVKILVLSDDRAEARFLDEAAVLAELSHPGLVRYVAHGVTPPGAPYLVMEWLEGEDLATYLQRLNPATVDSKTRSSSAHDDTVVMNGVMNGDIDVTIDSAMDGSPTDPDRSQAEKSAPADLTTVLPPGAMPGAMNAAMSAESAPPDHADAVRPARPALPGEHAGRVVPVHQALQLGRRLASAVAELHRRGIVHRDIKPANVYLCGSSLEHAKLLDLGAVRRPSIGARVTEPGTLIGTPHYMAPEQARANDDVGPQADVWAIGCVLYECLTGVRPFMGDSMLVVLTRIIVDDPPPVRLLRGEIPRPLARLIMQTLAKNPADRPADADMLVLRLDRIARMLGDRQRPLSRLRGAAVDDEMSAPVSITSVESRLTCMLFANVRGADRGHGRGTGAGAIDIDDEVLAEGVAECGGMLQRLADGTLLVTVPGTHTPADQAARAARAALTLRAAAPSLAMVLATGRIEVPSLMPLEQVVSQAAALLYRAAGAQIRLDDWTVSLLSTRFHIARDEHGALLEGERKHETMRTLLGKPSRWVGRHYELAMLMAMFEQCVHDETPCAVLVTAAAGMGKSRLRYELEQELMRRGQDLEILRGYGDAVSAGAPFIMIAPAVRWVAGILDGEPLEVRQNKLRARLAQTVPATELDRITRFLGEMIGVPFADDGHDALSAARTDPMVMGQLMQRAWEDWLRAECARRPVVLVLEDLHWGDVPSVLYVDGALGALAGSRLFVLALARPEVRTVFPQLWAQRPVRELPLYSLSQKASMTLIRDMLGERVSDEMAARLAERAGGNAFYLEELIRAVAEAGSGFDINRELPSTILGMVQTRLDALGPEAKQILRAASIFGEVFWQGGVEALVGPHQGVFDVGEWLADLVSREVVSRKAVARIPDETEFTFRHGLLRDGAYAMLTAEDRRLGHALAAEWLVAAGERDGLILGEHFIRGGTPERAVPWFQRAAEQALEGNDLGGAVRRAERGAMAGATGVWLGALRALQSVASYWQSDYAASRRFADEALELLPAGSSKWFLVVGSAIVSSARLSDPMRANQLALRAATEQCEPDAESAQIVCLCRGAFQLLFHGYLDEANQLLAHIAALTPDDSKLDAFTAAQVYHVRGLRAAHHGDKVTFLASLEETVDAFARAGDMRNAALERTSVAWCLAGLGQYQRAAELCRHNLELCRRSNAQQAITYAKVCLGYILSHLDGRRGEARQYLGEAIDECVEVGNLRLEGWARAHLTWVEHQDGAYQAEESLAACAAELLQSAPGLQSWALAAHARALLALGRPSEAAQRARQAMSILSRLGGMIQGEGLPPLMLVRTLHAAGDHDGAMAALTGAIARLDHRLSHLQDPAWRRAFLDKPTSRAIIELAEAWGVAHPVDSAVAVPAVSSRYDDEHARRSD